MDGRIERGKYKSVRKTNGTIGMAGYRGILPLCRFHVTWRSVQHEHQLCSYLGPVGLPMQSIVFSVKEFPFIQNITIANFQSEKLHNVGDNFMSSSFGQLSSKHCGTSERNVHADKTASNKPCLHLKAKKMTLNKRNSSGSKTNRARQTQLKHTEGIESSQQATVIVFDVETTGFSSSNDRIIEFAAQDLLGGKYSTFQTLVNPERSVPNQDVHGIGTEMVNRSDVPRWQDLAPILVQYIRSRQKAGALVLWVAHNARRFDVPFLVREFNRCSLHIPSDWRFVDTLPLAREVMNLNGSKRAHTSLKALREYYDLPLLGSAHRAMADVNTLALVLQKISFDLKLTVSGLLERSFKASDIT